MMMMTMQPVRVLLNRLFSGKYGSSAPVTGFLMVIGAMAVNSGRGRSCQRCEIHKFTLRLERYSQKFTNSQTSRNNPLVNLATASHLDVLEFGAVPAVRQR